MNGTWSPGAGFQLSGNYFFGSGERFWVDTGVDRRDEGGTSNTSEFRLRADGSILPRNSLIGKPIHKVDLRLQKRLPLLGRTTVDGIFEVFNLFNHENYGTDVVNESNANFRRPAFNANPQYFHASCSSASARHSSQRRQEEGWGGLGKTFPTLPAPSSSCHYRTFAVAPASRAMVDAHRRCRDYLDARSRGFGRGERR